MFFKFQKKQFLAFSLNVICLIYFSTDYKKKKLLSIEYTRSPAAGIKCTKIKKKFNTLYLLRMREKNNFERHKLFVF